MKRERTRGAKPAKGHSQASQPLQGSQVCILVLGMHRSGTSALTRVLNLHGVELGEDLLEPAADNNARGFWENRAVVTVHERLLADLGRSWHDPRPLPDGWLQSRAAAHASRDIATILGEFAGKTVFAIKDPRLCRFVDLWLPLLEQRAIRPVVVCVVRHPMEVADSIHRRDGWPHELSWLLWSRSTLDALASIEDVRRCVVSYKHLLADWRGTMAHIAAQLQLAWPVPSVRTVADVEAFLEPGEQHHVYPEAASDPRTPSFLLELYHAFLKIEAGGSWQSLVRFSALHAEFNRSTVPLHEELEPAGANDDSSARSSVTGGVVQLFYRKSDEPYSEERSAALEWPDSTNVGTFEFFFEIPVPVDALRIDFDDYAGVFLLDRLSINGQMVDTHGNVSTGNGTILNDRASSITGLLAAHNDPWIEVEVARTQCSRVKLSITRMPLHDAANSMRVSLDLSQRLDLLVEKVAALGVGLVARHGESIGLAALHAGESLKLVSRLSSELAQLPSLEPALAHTAGALGLHSKALEGLAVESAGHSSALDRLADELAKVRADVEAMGRDASAREGELGRSAEQTRALLAEQQSATSVLEQQISQLACAVIQNGGALSAITLELDQLSSRAAEQSTASESRAGQQLAAIEVLSAKAGQQQAAIEMLSAQAGQQRAAIEMLSAQAGQQLAAIKMLSAQVGQKRAGMASLSALVGEQRVDIHSLAAAARQQCDEIAAMVSFSRTAAELRKDEHGQLQSAVAQLGDHLAALTLGRRQDAVEMAHRLEQLEQAQQRVVHWAERRSMSYWWRRIRPGTGQEKVLVMGSGALQFEALGNIETNAGADGRASWRSLTDDPQLLLTKPGTAGGRWLGGWYELQLRIAATSGEILAPCLYPDYGGGASEKNRLNLPEPDADGWIRAIVLIRSEAPFLRFDASTRAADFVIENGDIRRLGRAEALLRMASAIAKSSRKSASASFVGTVLRFARHALAGRISEGGADVYQQYVDACATPIGYDEWVRRYDVSLPATIADMRTKASELVEKPLISIVMPVYQTPEIWLRRCIDSVLAQTYPNWQLCIADDASPSPHVGRVLREYMQKDERIRVVFRQANGHIAAASNSALALCKGEFIALLDHDDELPPHALLEVARAIAAHPEWRVIYSDEDKIDECGRRFDPYFKPDWNYELFLSQNCICHLGVYEAALVASVGGFRIGFDGSQDWDLALRCVEHLDGRQIGHIPKILYHWRAIAGSTALGVGQKDYAKNAGWRAVSDHLRRVGVDARVEVTDNGHLNVRRKLPTPAPKVSLVVPTRDKVDLLRLCIKSILEKTDYPDYEILVVDNESCETATLEYFAELASEPRVRVVGYHAPFNYSAINNFAVANTTGSIIGLVNNDIEVISPDWMSEMASQAVRPEIGAVGVMLFYPDDTIQHAGVILGIGGIAGHAYVGLREDSQAVSGRARLAQEMSAVTAACLFVRREVFDEVGGLDERLSVAFNDVDFCLRAREAGYRNLWTPYVRLYHHESASRGYEDTPAKIARFRREVDLMQSRWGEALLRDPAYNPNLTLDAIPFDLAFPPRYHGGI